MKGKYVGRFEIDLTYASSAGFVSTVDYRKAYILVQNNTGTSSGAVRVVQHWDGCDDLIEFDPTVSLTMTDKSVTEVDVSGTPGIEFRVHTAEAAKSISVFVYLTDEEPS